jgi:hypothetical protein
MDIRYRFTDDGLWIEAYEGLRLAGYVKFIFHKKDYIWSASTLVMPSFRGSKVATLIYLYAHDLGYEIRPSKMQTPEGKLMWKGFKRAKLPFVRPTLLERIWTVSVKLIG